MNMEDNRLSSVNDDIGKREQDLKSEITALEVKLSSLKDTADAIHARIDGILLKQIEILTVYIAVVSLIITNIIGLDALGNIGIKGLIRINLVYVVSVFIILIGVKVFILGFKKRQ